MKSTYENGQPHDSSLLSISVIVIDATGTVTSQTLRKVLFDPGSTKIVISKNTLPEGTVPLKLGNTQHASTPVCAMKVNEMVTLRNLKLPEFN